MLPSRVYCDNCGAANRPQARFCISCGQTMPSASALPPTGLASPTSSSTSLTGLLPANLLLKQRYLILSKLGQGGMGAVYKAADTQLGDRPVAVKEMSQKGLDPQEVVEAAEAFKREALMLAALPHHSHLPSIYDHFGDGGRWYLVMDFIEGETLEDYLAKAGGGGLPVKEVLDIGIQLAMVLGYLHSHQPPIIFRDLKPTNVMRAADGQLYLIDFGIARHFKPGQAKDTFAYGSAGYAAPEQYGRAQTMPQSDIFSLGATLHHLLSGNNPALTPFRFAPLSGAGITAELSALIVRMVDMDNTKRLASMVEVKEELQHIATSVKTSQLAPTQYAGGAAPTQLVVKTPPTQLPLPVPQQSVSPKRSPAVSPPSQPKPVRALSPQGTVICTYRAHTDKVWCVAWSPDGKRIASGGKDKTVRVWSAVTGKNLLTYSGHSEKVVSVAWSPDSTRIASGEGGKFMRVWDAQSGTERLACGGHGNWWEGWGVTGVAWSPDGTRLASTAAPIKEVRIWDVASGKNLFVYRGHANWVYAVAWSPDGRRIASGGGSIEPRVRGDNTIQVWDATNGDRAFVCRGHTHLVYALAWSPDGRRIASASSDQTVQVWDAGTGKNLLAYRGHAGEVMSAAWSPDGKRIASAGYDRTVRIWDATNGGNIYTYSGHSDAVLSVAWSPDGKCIASASHDKTVQVWQAEKVNV